MKSLLFVGFAAIAPVHAASVTFSAADNFSVSNQSLFGGQAASSFSDSFRIGPPAAQIYASAQASSGSVSSSGTAIYSLTYEDELTVSSASDALLILTGSATAGFSTAFGATFQGGVGTSFLGIGDFNPLIDQGYSLNASGSNANLSSPASGFDDQAFARVGFSTPGLITSVGMDANATQTSTLTLNSLTASITARNVSTGTTRSQTVSFADGTPVASVPFDLAEAGTWELTVTSISVSNVFQSIFGISVSADAGFGIGFDCGDLFDDDDNGFFCGGDAGTRVSSEPLDLADVAGFGLAYTGFGVRNMGSITVLANPISEVPLPGALVFALTAFAGWHFRQGAR